MIFKKPPFISSLLNFDGLSGIDKKRARLMLTFSLVWIIQTIFSIFVSVIKYNSNLMLAGHLFDFVGILLVFYFLYKRQQTAALVLFISLVLITTILFTNVLSPAKYAEYFYIFVAPLILIFTEKKVLIYFGFIVSYLAFIIPNKFYHIYPDEYYQDDYFAFILFIIVFFLVYYFKSINSKNEKLLEIKTKELEELNQFQSQFFINISHEIKTPLTLIRGQADKIKETKVKRKIDVQINNIQKIVDDVIDLSKMSNNSFSLHKEVVDLKSLVYKIHISFESLFAQKKITFTFINSEHDFFILADALYLERAINNLMLNAYKYTDKKGKVIIKLNKIEDTIQLSISDTGIGIDKKNVDKIFNRFYQVNNDFNQTGGSGIGLAFTKEIITLLEGEIIVESKPNIGTTFKVLFPVVNNLKNKIKTENISTSVSSKNDLTDVVFDKSITILIVDDSVEMRSYLKELLQEYKCIEADNGIEALELLKEKKVDFIVTDYMMPKMNGFELITYMKNNNMFIPTLMLTARSDNDSKLQVLRLGINDYLSKPFDKNELLIRIHNILKNQYNREKFVLKEEISDEEINENTEWLVKLKNCIIKKCHNPKLNQVEIAEHFNVSKSTFYRKVKMETGLTPNEFINEIKLLQARKIVEKQSDISLKELSLKVGYLHTSYFATQYKKRFGVHPIKQAQN
ncbi:hybrid sensor histidine kinase/response regulator transcription factor [Wenyingzhuangia sp. IMCC45467]